MAKQTNITVEGVITEALGNSIFRAELDNGHTVVAHLSGKIRLNSIQILPGDFVQMEMSPYDLSKARIVRRISTRTKIE
jgi:translation initiation factor IF-1